MDKKKKKIIFTAGGSGGPVSPLIAIAEALSSEKDKGLDFLFVGTKNGPERKMLEKGNMRFRYIFGGKLRRYFSLKNFSDFFLIIFGFFQSLLLIKNEKPGLIMSAGSFASVPLVWAAWILRVPIFIHQQDYRPGLANKLMSPFADTVTVSFEKSLSDYGQKAVWTGNPIRQDFVKIKISKREAAQKFGLRTDKPVLLVMGGGTGAQTINDILLDSINELRKFCQIIHICGQGKSGSLNDLTMEKVPEYKYFEFLDIFGLIKAYSVADVIVSRCGMGALSEISQLGLNAILIPIPDSHQEENAEIFKKNEAATVLGQKNLNKELFIKAIEVKIKDREIRERHQENIKKIFKENADKNIASLIIKKINESKR